MVKQTDCAVRGDPFTSRSEFFGVAMRKTVIVKFRVKNKGGRLAGQTLEREVPEFNWDEFKNLPNAKEFVEKSYLQSVRRIVREIEERSFLSTDSDLVSMESVITRSLSYTKEEISDWIGSRQWELVEFKTRKERAIEILQDKLTALSQGPVLFDDIQKNRMAEIIASVADKPSDKVAEYLFSRLTLPVAVADPDAINL